MQSLSQHRSRRGDAPGGVPRTVLWGEQGSSAAAPRRLTRPLWAAGPLATPQSRLASTLTAFARAKRSQLDALRAAGMTASLRLEVEGGTRLASLLRTRENLPAATARRSVRRVFTLHRARRMEVLVERC